MFKVSSTILNFELTMNLNTNHLVVTLTVYVSDKCAAIYVYSKKENRDSHHISVTYNLIVGRETGSYAYSFKLHKQKPLSQNH